MRTEVLVRGKSTSRRQSSRRRCTSAARRKRRKVRAGRYSYRRKSESKSKSGGRSRSQSRSRRKGRKAAWLLIATSISTVIHVPLLLMLVHFTNQTEQSLTYVRTGASNGTGQSLSRVPRLRSKSHYRQGGHPISDARMKQGNCLDCHAVTPPPLFSYYFMF